MLLPGRVGVDAGFQPGAYRYADVDADGGAAVGADAHCHPHVDRDDVTRRAGDVGHDHPVLADERVAERRLAGVRRTEQRDAADRATRAVKATACGRSLPSSSSRSTKARVSPYSGREWSHGTDEENEAAATLQAVQRGRMARQPRARRPATGGAPKA